MIKAGRQHSLPASWRPLTKSTGPHPLRGYRLALRRLVRRRASRRRGGRFPDDLVDEAELVECGGGEDERVGILQAHAAVQVVEDVGQGEPALDDLVERRGVLVVETRCWASARARPSASVGARDRTRRPSPGCRSCAGNGPRSRPSPPRGAHWRRPRRTTRARPAERLARDGAGAPDRSLAVSSPKRRRNSSISGLSRIRRSQ